MTRFERFTDRPKSQTAGQWIELAEQTIDSYAFEVARLQEALLEAEVSLVFAGADIEVEPDGFVPTPTLGLRIVRAALKPNARLDGACKD